MANMEWVKIKPPGIGPQVKSSMFPFARVPLWVPVFDPHPHVKHGKHGKDEGTHSHEFLQFTNLVSEDTVNGVIEGFSSHLSER